MKIAIAEVLTPVDVCVIGGGIAGATVASSLSSALAVSVWAHSLECSSAWAQGGIAAARHLDDSPRFHAQDTVAAGAGLNHPRAVQVLTEEAPSAIDFLAHLGVDFGSEGAQEGGHSRPRVWHPEGDASGRDILRALHQELARISRAPQQAVFVDVVLDKGRAAGVILAREGRYLYAPARNVVLASGGYGGLWSQTTNPPGNRGDAIACALRIGVPVSDLEFVQYHPTAFAGKERPLALITEALRGAGARLVLDGDESIFDNSEGNLSTRDVVSRAVVRAQQRGVVTLDCRHLGRALLEKDFPTFVANCQRRGLDPLCDLIPITPAVHYTMGGICTDEWGSTECGGLYAVGECANTGLHGGNRLASNSLAEGVVFGRRVALSCEASPSYSPTFADISEWERAVEDQASVEQVGLALDTGAGIIRSERDALEGRELLEQWQERTPSGPNGTGALVARHVLAAVLARTSSVGSHWRQDGRQEGSTEKEIVFRGIDKLVEIARSECREVRHEDG